MKELEITPKDNVQVVDEQKKTRTLFAQKMKRPGHILFEYNHETHKLSIANFKEITAVVDSYVTPKTDINNPYKVSQKVGLKSTVETRDNCMYFQALNAKSAVKKLAKYQLPVAP